MNDTHPLTFFGALIAGGGWLFLVLGTGTDIGDYGSRSVYNVHLGAIAENVILLGYAVAIAGVIANVGKILSMRELIAPASVEDPSAQHSTADATLEKAPAPARAAALRQALDRNRTNP